MFEISFGFDFEALEAQLNQLEPMEMYEKALTKADEDPFFKMPQKQDEEKVHVVTSNNIQFIYNLIGYLSNAKMMVDFKLVELLIKILRVLPRFTFKGFPDNTKAKESFELRFYSGID